MAIIDWSELRAKIEWADEQIISLNEQIDTFMNSQMDRSTPNIIRWTTLPLPHRLRVTTGLIIHAQRSSLDNLMTALGTRGPGSNNASKQHFPIRETRDEFQGDRRVRKALGTLHPLT
jgi:hypothetical protein